MAPLILCHLGSLVLVTLLFGTLAPSNANPIQKLCERMRKDPKNVNQQALSPVGDQLHLIAWDILYTVPFTSETIDSTLGRMLLKGTDPGTKWTQVPWLKTLAGGVKTPDPVLIQLTVWPDFIESPPTSKTQQISLLYRAQDTNILFHNWLYPAHEHEKLPIKPYGLIHSGNRHSGPVFEFRDLVDFKIKIGMIADVNVYVLPDISVDNKTLVFRTNFQEKDLVHHPLVTKLPIFGFIHSKVVHLWDLESGQVILFDYVPQLDEKTKSGEYKSVPLRLVPFEEYLVCSSDGKNVPNGPVSNPPILNESTIKHENSAGPDSPDGSEESGFSWIWILLLVVLIILGASGFWFYKFRLYKRTKKTNNVSKSTSTPSFRSKISPGGSTSSRPKSTNSTSPASSSGLKPSRSKNPETVPKTPNKIDVSGLSKSSTPKLSAAATSESKNTRSTTVPKFSSKIQDLSSGALKAKSIPKSTISSASSNKKSNGVAGKPKVSSKIQASRSDLSLGLKSSTLKSMLSSEQ